MPSLPKFKKLVISGILSVFLLTNFLFIFTPSALAQAIPIPKATPRPTWYSQNFKDWYKKVYDSPENDVFGERYTAANVEWIIYGLFAFIINKFSGNPKATSCYMNNDLKNCISYLKNALSFAPEGSGGFAQTAPQGILSYIFLQDRPLSGITYFRNVARNWHLIPEAKAQTPGFGFNALNPVLPLWRASRNVAYAVLVFAIIILSFMIMFRVKINPQTVVTVQSAIPKVVFALILITFSYAIAGFMVDLMYVVIGLISLILSQTYGGFGVPIFNVNIGPINAGTGPRTFFDFMTVGPAGGGITNALLIYLTLASVVTIIVVFASGGLIAGTAVSTIGLFLYPILAIIFFIILLFMIIRVVWTLLKAFAYVVLLVAVAPLQIALGVVVPGLGFGSWVRSFASNLAVFPLTGLFLSLAFLFLFMAFQMSLSSAISDFSQFAGIPVIGPVLLGLRTFLGGIFDPSRNAGWPPLLGAGSNAAQAFIYLAVSVVILLILPKVADIIKTVIEGKPFEYGAAIGQAFGPITGAAGFGTAAGIGVGAERLQRAYPATSAQYQTIGQIAQALQKWAAGGFKR